MKLIFCLYKYFPYGGLQRDFLRFHEVAVSRGHEVRVYCRSWQGPKPQNLDLTLLPAPGLSNHRRNSNFINSLQHALAGMEYDAVVGFDKMPGLDLYYAADSCYEAKARNERSALYRLGSRYRHFSRFERSVFGNDSKTRIMLISEIEKKKYLHFYPEAESRMMMLPPGISRDRCYPPEGPLIRKSKREELGIANDEFLLLFLGSGFIKKGLARAIHAVAGLPDELQRRTRLVVVGTGKPEKFADLAAKCGVTDRVFFLGGRDDIPQLLLAADLMVHPALDEAAGIALVEAVVAGLPVIVTDICGYAFHIARAECGTVLSTPFSQSALQNALAHALNSSELLVQWHRNALAYAAREDLYSMHETGMDYIENRTR